MRRLLLAACSLAVALSGSCADDTLKTPTTPTPKAGGTKTITTAADPKPLDEVWEAAYVQDGKGGDVKIGYVHLTSVPVTADGQRLIRTTKELRFVIGRAGQEAELKADVTTDEDGAGKVHAIQARTWLGKEKVQTRTFKIDGDRITVDIGAGEQQYRWDPNNLGLAAEQTLLRDKKAKPGDKFTYRYYETQITHPVTVNVEVKPEEEVALPGGVKRKLLKVVATPEPIDLADGKKFQLPSGVFWADPIGYDTVKTAMEVPGLGVVSLVRTSKTAALAPNGDVPDLMKQQSIFLRAAIPGMHERNAIVYRISYQGNAAPKDLLSTDDRQAIRNISGNTFDLVITAKRKPLGEGAEKAGDEFLKSNYFLNSDDEQVQKLARQAVGTETDPWKKAQRIESWVRHNMRAAEYTEAMAPADHVARTLTGDCTEFSMLAAGMCKAQGIPARTAIGLVYVDNLLGKPGFAFHMWTEVFVKGQWLAIDATLGQGSIGAGHIKITDHSWANLKSFTPLLPVQGFLMAKPKIEVIEK